MTLQLFRRGILYSILAATALTGCGGGGSSTSNGAGNGTGGTPPPPPAPPPVSTDALNEASRFADSATFGLPYADIEALATSGTDDWLDAQFQAPVTLHRPLVESLVARRDTGEFDAVEDDIELLISFRRYAWWHHTMTAEDQLRQRTAYALSQIFVVSDNVDTLILDPVALSDYYDVLLANAFGNFRDLLRSVSLHPAMGTYLSHVNNRRSDPVANIFPDENYAREIMQLFSIGLFELAVDGTQLVDGNGEPIPTYGNEEIREFAKIFTGLSYGGAQAFFGNRMPNFGEPMEMFDAFHEPGEKRLLNDAVVPAGQTGEQDIDAGIDNLFNHPNVGPFIGKQLIQRLVTSNPSPAYVARVAGVFNDNGAGVRGDMQAVVRAVLVDPEALTAPDPQRDFGKLREPVLRYVALLRQLEAESSDGFFFNAGFFLQELIAQHPLAAPSVFNFYLPAHTPAGEFADADMVAPEFQITTTTTIAGATNLVDLVVNADFGMDAEPPFGQVAIDWSGLAAMTDIDELLDRLDVLFTYGTLSDDTRSAITGILAEIPDAEFRARTAVYMLLISPDYAARF